MLSMSQIFAKVDPQDVEALQNLYNATNGPQWYWFKWDPEMLQQGQVCSLTHVTCNALRTRVTEISLAINGLKGTLPDSIGQLSALTKLDLPGNDLFGSIPSTMTKLTALIELKLNTQHFTGSIPQNIGQLYNLKTLQLGQNELNGTVPSTICNLTQITDFEIEYNQITGSIPECIGNLHKMRVMLWQNNNLEGTIPSGLGNSTHLASMTLSHNKLTGRVPDSFALLPNIKDFLINDNDLYSDNFGEILASLLRSNNKLANYKSIQVHNNPKLGGDLSALENMGNVSIYSLTAFNCDLCGSIPKTIQFQNVGEFYLWGNRLSCELPMNLLSMDLSSNMATFSPFAVLQSNLFWIKSIHSKPKWLTEHDSFSSASLLYVTQFDEIISWIVAVFTGLCILVFMIKKLYICIQYMVSKTSQMSNNPHNDVLLQESDNQHNSALLCVNDNQLHESDKTSASQPIIKDIAMKPSRNEASLQVSGNQRFDALFRFWSNVEYIKKALDDMKLVLIAVALLIFYGYTSTYFQCSPILSKLSLGFYKAQHQYYDWILVAVLFPLIYICFWYCIINAQIAQFQQQQKYQSADNLNIFGHNTRNRQRAKSCTYITTICWFLFYLCLFLGCTAFVIISIIFESLPEHNSICGLPSMATNTMKILRYSMAIILTLNTAIIVPNVTDCSYLFIKLCCKSWSDSNYLQKYRPFIILLLRTLSTIIIPTIASMFLLNDCGKNWTHFWIECDEAHRSQFDSHISKQYIYMTHESVCDPVSFADISWDKCFRSFSTKWSFIIIQKLFYMILMPIFMILFKNCKMFASTKLDKSKEKKNIVFDVEYTMILTKCESMIIFGVISPFIIPLTIFSVDSNYFFYRTIMNSKSKKWNPYLWRAKPYDNNILFPIYFLWISVFISQAFVCCFVYVCIDKSKVGSLLKVLIALLALIDVISVAYYIQRRKLNERILSNVAQRTVNQ